MLVSEKFLFCQISPLKGIDTSSLAFSFCFYLNIFSFDDVEEKRIPFFIEQVYNTKHLHSSLGYVPPDEFELISGSFLLSLLFNGMYTYFTNQSFASVTQHIGAPLKKPFKPALEFLSPQYHEGDLIAHTNYFTLFSFRFYFPDKNTQQYYLMHLKAQDPYWRKSLERAPFTIRLDKTFPDTDKVWLIASNWERDGKIDEN